MASRLELGSEFRPVPEEVKRAVEEIVAACGGVSRGWHDWILRFDIEGKEASAVLSLGERGYEYSIIVGDESIAVNLEFELVMVWKRVETKNVVTFRLSKYSPKVCTALRILASDCGGGNVAECRERKVERLVDELGLDGVRCWYRR